MTGDLLELLAYAGVEHKAQPDWRTHARPGPFRPVGVMLHHTAGPKAGDAPSLQVCIHGRTELKGPLCHFLVARSGLVHVISQGLCNHAGSGSERALGCVLADLPSPDRPTDIETAHGNENFWGIEVENTGMGEPYPDAQVSAFVSVAAVLCWWNGWTSHRVIHHRQWTRRKVDMSWHGDTAALVQGRMAAFESLTYG